MLARVMSKAALLLCLLAAALAQDPAAQQPQAQQDAPLEVQEIPLESFNEVDICLPVSVLIQPNASSEAYSLILEGEPAVLEALTYNVTNGVLALGANDLFTNRPIKITVIMPANALQTINHQGTGAEVFVGSGFNLENFVASTAFGAGRLFVDGMVAQTASLLLSGTGDGVLIGSFGSVNATSTGTGGLYIVGANDTVLLDLRGVSNAFVQPAMPTAAITGTAQGINTVQYTEGTCDMRSNFIFLQICQAVPFISIPAANPVWTCGLQVQGSFQCSEQGTAFTSAGGFVGTSGSEGTVPVTTTTPTGISAFTPSSFQFAGASPTGPGTGVQQQAGSVTPGSTTAASNIAGTGSVSATSVATPAGATTATTQGGQTTAFQTTGQQTTGGTTGTTGVGGTGTTSRATASATASSTAFTTASPASTVAVSSSQQANQGQASSGVIRVGADGQSEATATSQICMALAAELRMPIQTSA